MTKLQTSLFQSIFQVLFSYSFIFPSSGDGLSRIGEDQGGVRIFQGGTKILSTKSKKIKGYRKNICIHEFFIIKKWCSLRKKFFEHIETERRPFKRMFPERAFQSSGGQSVQTFWKNINLLSHSVLE